MISKHFTATPRIPPTSVALKVASINCNFTVEPQTFTTDLTVVKVCGSTVKLQLILAVLSTVEVGGIRGVEVKCIDITKNSECEGCSLDCN